MTTTATGNLRTIVDLRNILADINKEGGGLGGKIDMGMALHELPRLEMIQGAMQASTISRVAELGKDDQFAFSMAKALDIIGAATDPARFDRESGAMAQAIIGMQGRVTPEAYKNVFWYMRQAGIGLDDSFKYARGLPTLILESASAGAGGGGGGQRGVGPIIAAGYRAVVQGFNVNKKTIPLLEALGLLQPGFTVRPGQAPLWDSKSGKDVMTQGATVGGWIHSDVAARDPFAYATEVMLPRMAKYLHAGVDASDPAGLLKWASEHREQVSMLLGEMFKGNQGAAFLYQRLIVMATNFVRDAQVIGDTLPFDKAFLRSLWTDPTMAFAAFNAQWDNFKTALGTTVIPIILPILRSLTNALNELSLAAQAHPFIASAFTWSLSFASALLFVAGIGMVVAALVKGARTVLWLFGLWRLAGLTTAGVGAAAGVAARVGAGMFAGASLAGLGAAIVDVLTLALATASVVGLGAAIYAAFKGAVTTGTDMVAAGRAGYTPAMINEYNQPVGYWKDGKYYTNQEVEAALAQAKGTTSSELGYHRGALPPPPGTITGQGWHEPTQTPLITGETIIEGIVNAISSAMHGLHIEMDGRVVGQIVGAAMEKEHSRPPADSNQIDPLMTPVYPGNFN
jgi:hypothetical protein